MGVVAEVVVEVMAGMLQQMRLMMVTQPLPRGRRRRAAGMVVVVVMVVVIVVVTRPPL